MPSLFLKGYFHRNTIQSYRNSFLRWQPGMAWRSFGYTQIQHLPILKIPQPDWASFFGNSKQTFAQLMLLKTYLPKRLLMGSVKLQRCKKLLKHRKLHCQSPLGKRLICANIIWKRTNFTAFPKFQQQFAHLESLKTQAQKMYFYSHYPSLM